MVGGTKAREKVIDLSMKIGDFEVEDQKIDHL